MPVQQIAVVEPKQKQMDVTASQQTQHGSCLKTEQHEAQTGPNIVGGNVEFDETLNFGNGISAENVAKNATENTADMNDHVEADTVIIRDCCSNQSLLDDQTAGVEHGSETQVCVHAGQEVMNTENVANNGKKVKLSGKVNKKEKTTPIKKKDSDTQEILHPNSPTPVSVECCDSSLSNIDVCRICQCDTCEIQKESPLVAPCLCSGSLKYIHQACLQKWIKSSDKMSCELCQFDYQMTKKMKPFREWEKLDMTPAERRKVVCSVTFHVIAITCVVWSLYVLIDRTTEEVQAGSLLWPFWTKLIVVAIGFTGGVVFMYVQCKMYVNLCKKWRTYNKVILVNSLSEAQREKANHEGIMKLSKKQAQLEEDRGTNFDVFTIVQES